MPLNEIEQEVLKALLDKEKLTMRALIAIVNRSPNAILAAVNKLVRLGLLEEMREREFPKRRLVKLTSKGAKVAELLHQLDLILRDSN
ncbi:MAG: winged helix-turn-helix transcriptional regulator [Candidatus Nezhaarchaeales archaeon]